MTGTTSSPAAPAGTDAARGGTPRGPLLGGLLGALLIAGSAPLVAASDVQPLTSAMFRCLYALPVLALLAARERRTAATRSWRERRWPLLAGVCFAMDLGTWHYAIDLVGAGLATVLANTQVVVVGLVAWAVLGERPRARVLWGVPVVLAGIVLISGVTGGGYGADPAAGAALGMGTALAYSGYLLLLRQGGRGGAPVSALLDATAAAAACLAVVGVLAGVVDLAPSWPAHGWLLLLALNSQVVAWLLIARSLPQLPAVVTSVLLMVQPVGSVALGVALLGEDPSPAQYVGVALVLTGAAVATLWPGRRRRHARAGLPA